jgi:hypothetical protein
MPCGCKERGDAILRGVSAARISEIFGVGRHSAKVTAAEAKRIAALPVAQRGPVLFNRVYGVGNPTKMRVFNTPARTTAGCTAAAA